MTASKLGQILAGRLARAHKYLFYGVPGIGKTKLALCSPKPIIFDLEGGSDKYHAARYPFKSHESGGKATYQEILDGILDLTISDHDYKSLVIDTEREVEAAIWDFICHRDQAQYAKTKLRNIEDYGYHKGYTVACAEFRSFLTALDRLRSKKGMRIILIGHAKIVTYKNPEGADYDQFKQDIHKLAAKEAFSWADTVGFCAYENSTVRKKKADGKAGAPIGFTTDRRMMFFKYAAAYDAKDRLGRESIEMLLDDSWAPFMDEGTPVAVVADPPLKADLDPLEQVKDKYTATTLIASCKGYLELIEDNDIKVKAIKYIAENRDNEDALGKLVQRLHDVLRKQKESAEK